MGKRLAITISLVLVLLLVLSIWVAKLIWFKPFSIDHFFERVYIEFLWNDPEALTQTRVLESYGLNSYEDQLTDLSPKSTSQLAEIGRRNLEILENYDTEGLSDQQLVSYQILHWFLKTGVSAEPFLFHDYLITHISGAHIDLPQFLAGAHQINNKEDAVNYLNRLKGINEKFGSLIDGLEKRKKSGVILPTFILQKAITFCDNFTKTPIEKNVLFTSYKQKLSEVKLLENAEDQEQLGECLKILRTEVYPAYKRLSGYLLQLEQSSLAIAGVWQLPNGDQYYRNCLLQQTTLNLDPDSLYEFGKMELSRLKGEIEILKSLGEKTDEERFQTDSVGRLQTLDYFKAVSSRVETLLPSYFETLSSIELSVLELPEYRANNSPLALYIPPRGEPLSNGKLYVNTWKAENLSKNLAKSYAYHEGIPGHHLQKAIQVELKNLPTFRRFLPFEAYTEGWAMYAEQLGHEMTETEDPDDKIGLLQSDLFRTARMMTDIGIHHKKWLREQAIDFMVENAELSESDATDEVDRYIVWPGQGCAYKVGQLKFLELRKLTENALGDRFDIKKFHDVLIGNGAMPLEVLEKRVALFIEREKNAS